LRYNFSRLRNLFQKKSACTTTLRNDTIYTKIVLNFYFTQIQNKTLNPLSSNVEYTPHDVYVVVGEIVKDLVNFIEKV